MLLFKWFYNVKKMLEGLFYFNRLMFWSKILVYFGGWLIGEVIKNIGIVKKVYKNKKKICGVLLNDF